MIKPIILSALFISAVVSAKSYDVEAKGHSVGEAELTISVTDNSYAVELLLDPMFLAEMFLDDMRETVSGNIASRHFYPDRYQRKEDDGTLLLSVSFDGARARVKNENGEASTLDISTKGQDPLSQIAQIQHDLKRGKIQPAYFLVTDRGQQHYRATRNGNTVSLVQHPSKRRQIQLTFNERYELVSMKKIKEGDVDFLLTEKN